MLIICLKRPALAIDLPSSGGSGGLVLMHTRVDLVQGLVVVDGAALVGLGVSTGGGCGRVGGSCARSASGSGMVLLMGVGVVVVVVVGPEGILDLVDDGRHVVGCLVLVLLLICV